MDPSGFALEVSMGFPRPPATRVATPSLRRTASTSLLPAENTDGPGNRIGSAATAGPPVSVEPTMSFRRPSSRIWRGGLPAQRRGGVTLRASREGWSGLGDPATPRGTGRSSPCAARGPAGLEMTLETSRPGRLPGVGVPLTTTTTNLALATPPQCAEEL